MLQCYVADESSIMLGVARRQVLLLVGVLCRSCAAGRGCVVPSGAVVCCRNDIDSYLFPPCNLNEKTENKGVEKKEKFSLFEVETKDTTQSSQKAKETRESSSHGITTSSSKQLAITTL